MSTKEALYKLLRIALGNESDLTLPQNIYLSEVMDLSEKAGISGLALCGLQKLTDNGFDFASNTKEEKQRRMKWLGRSLLLAQKTKTQLDSIQSLVRLFASKGIITIGLKGVTVGQWYPDPLHRDSCDFDCFLIKKGGDGTRPFAYEEGNKAVEALGIDVDRRIYVHSVFSFEGLTVENHHYLAAVKLSKRHREMDKLLRTLIVNEPLQPMKDLRLMMGSPMFNALFLTHHAHRHMLNEYMPLKLLTDWALFIKNNATLDWAQFWNYADEFRMLRFAQTMTRLSCKLLGANVPFELPSDDKADIVLESSLWNMPVGSQRQKSLFLRHLGIVSNLFRARKRYKVFYDQSSFGMILAYVKGYLFGREE